MRPKDGSSGNHSRDQQWIKEHADSLVRIEDGEYAGLLQYTGKEDQGSIWTLPREDQRCTATAYIRDEDGQYILFPDGTRIRRPCYQWRMHGSNVCVNHGGGSEAARRRAQERMLGAINNAAGILVRIAQNSRTPVKERLRALQMIMDYCGLRPGVEIEISEPRYQAVWDDFKAQLLKKHNVDLDEALPMGRGD